MKLGDVLRKERERRKLTAEKVAEELALSAKDYSEMEAGESPLEEWGPRLAQIAIKLSVPTARLISETGKSKQANGQCGKNIKTHRERRGLSQDELANQIGVSTAEIVSIEDGNSPLESHAPLLLRFAELVEQPIFNFFYPCGLPLDSIQDYP